MEKIAVKGARQNQTIGNSNNRHLRNDCNGYSTTVELSGEHPERVLKEACTIYIKWLKKFNDLTRVFYYKD